jgi:chloramphenicol-sensitive protein RarD
MKISIFAPRMEHRKHYAAAIAAFIVWGFFSIPLRALIEYSAGQILFFRILFSFIVLITIVPFRTNVFAADWHKFLALGTRGRKAVIFLTIAGGVLLTVNWLTFIYIVNNINIKTASFSYLICPVITAVLGYALIREKLSRLQWVAVGLCGLSCVLMGLNSRLELGYSFLTAFTYALYLITQRKNQGFDRIVMLTLQVTISLVVLAFMYQFLVDAVPGEEKFYGIIAVIAIAFTVLPLFLNLFALNRINSATIGILMYLNPIFNFSVAFLVFDESVSTLQLTGYAIILIALVVFNYHNVRKLSAKVETAASFGQK